jgi:hypothetical protein
MDDARRDALKSASRVAVQVVTKSAHKLSQIAGANSSDPGDLPSIDTTPRAQSSKIFSTVEVANGGAAAQYKADI